MSTEEPPARRPPARRPPSPQSPTSSEAASASPPTTPTTPSTPETTPPDSPRKQSEETLITREPPPEHAASDIQWMGRRSSLRHPLVVANGSDMMSDLFSIPFIKYYRLLQGHLQYSAIRKKYVNAVHQAARDIPRAKVYHDETRSSYFEFAIDWDQAGSHTVLFDGTDRAEIAALKPVDRYVVAWLVFGSISNLSQEELIHTAIIFYLTSFSSEKAFWEALNNGVLDKALWYLFDQGLMNGPLDSLKAQTPEGEALRNTFYQQLNTAYDARINQNTISDIILNMSLSQQGVYDVTSYLFPDLFYTAEQLPFFGLQGFTDCLMQQSGHFKDQAFVIKPEGVEVQCEKDFLLSMPNWDNFDTSSVNFSYQFTARNGQVVHFTIEQVRKHDLPRNFPVPEVFCPVIAMSTWYPTALALFVMQEVFQNALENYTVLEKHLGADFLDRLNEYSLRPLATHEIDAFLQRVKTTIEQAKKDVKDKGELEIIEGLDRSLTRVQELKRFYEYTENFVAKNRYSVYEPAIILAGQALATLMKLPLGPVRDHFKAAALALILQPTNDSAESFQSQLQGMLETTRDSGRSGVKLASENDGNAYANNSIQALLEYTQEYAKAWQQIQYVHQLTDFIGKLTSTVPSGRLKKRYSPGFTKDDLAKLDHALLQSLVEPIMMMLEHYQQHKLSKGLNKQFAAMAKAIGIPPKNKTHSLLCLVLLVQIDKLLQFDLNYKQISFADEWGIQLLKAKDILVQHFRKLLGDHDMAVESLYDSFAKCLGQWQHYAQKTMDTKYHAETESFAADLISASMQYATIMANKVNTDYATGNSAADLKAWLDVLPLQQGAFIDRDEKFLRIIQARLEALYLPGNSQNTQRQLSHFSLGNDPSMVGPGLDNLEDNSENNSKDSAPSITPS